MHVISRDAPCYYLTSVTRNRLPIFQKDQVKLIICAAINEARQSANFALYSYVIMPDHLHIITDATLSPGKTLQFINGITAHRVIQYLKETTTRVLCRNCNIVARRDNIAIRFGITILTRDCCLQKTC
jgi:REP element-mobilizing transposase RayT